VKEINSMRLEFAARAENESFARMTVSAFMMQLNPTLEQMTDVKTAVSEAVTNAVVHAYPGRTDGKVWLSARLFEERAVEIQVEDSGVGIADVSEAMEPFYTTQPEAERSGMGFQVMKSFMDDLQVISEKERGTKVKMRKMLE